MKVFLLEPLRSGDALLALRRPIVCVTLRIGLTHKQEHELPLEYEADEEGRPPILTFQAKIHSFRWTDTDSLEFQCEGTILPSETGLRCCIAFSYCQRAGSKHTLNIHYN